MKIFNHIIILFMLTVLSACVEKSANPYLSREAIHLTEEEIGVLTDDLYAVINDRYGPGQTTFRFFPPQESQLAQAIETRLREGGYAIASSDGLPLMYIVDALSVDQVLIRLSVAEEYQANRVYVRDYDGFHSATGFTVRNQGT